MKINLLITFIFLCSTIAHAGVDDKLNEIKAKSVEKATEFKKEIGSSKVVIDAILAANKKYPAGMVRNDKEPVGDIAAKDKDWIAWFKSAKLAKLKKESAPPMPADVAAVMNNPCSELLKQAVDKDPDVTEAFVMDKMGANVCAADPTSDYDQGDEDKWLMPWTKNVNPHVGNPTRDASADTFQTQVSFLIENHGEKIGVITIGVGAKAHK